MQIRSEADEAEQLSLFDTGGVNVSRLREMRDRLQIVNRSVATVRGYAADWKMFGSWCDRAGRCPLPASPDTLELYVTWLIAECGRKVSTGSRHIAAIRHRHRISGLTPPTTTGILPVMDSVRRERSERPVGKRALSVPELVQISKACNTATNTGARDRALIVLGFATSLRRSELVALQVADISFESVGIAVLVRRSKVDQEGRGRLIGVWSGQRAETDPVRVLKEWMKRRGTAPGPLFVRINAGDSLTTKPLSGEAVNKRLKRCMERAGLESKLFGAHSLRAGSLTASAKLGRSDQELMILSGHAGADMVKIYIRDARIFDGRNPLAGVL